MIMVQCHGCFDLLHPGHIEHLEAARKLGDLLTVSVTSDRHVTKQKGPRRPIYSEDERVKMLLALKCVTHAFVDDNPNAVSAINIVRPHIFVKGLDYNDDRIDQSEYEAVRAIGGEVVYTNTPKMSTTEIIERCGLAYMEQE